MIIVVGAVITDDLDRPTRVLAARRTRPPELAGRWEFPGGKLEPGETPVAALERELAEELGLTRVSVGAEITGPTPAGWPIGPDRVMRLYPVVTDQTPEPADGSHDDLRWLTAGSLDDVAWLATDAEAVIGLRHLLTRTHP